MSSANASQSPPTAAPTVFRVVTKADLASQLPSQLDDPAGIARLSDEKRAAFLANPLSDSDRDPCQILGISGSRVIARLDVIAGRLETHNGPIPMLWASSLFVPPEHRKSLAGITIILKLHSLAPTLGVCGVSQMALPLYENLKWLNFPLSRYIMIRRSNSVLRRYLGDNLLAGAAAGLTNLALRGHRSLFRLFAHRLASGLHVQPVSQVSPALDPLLSAHRQPVATHRSAAYLNWQLQHCFDHYPNARRELFLINDRANAPLGYFLLKSRLYETATHRGFKNLVLGSLVDWHIFEPSRLSFKQILYFAMAALNSWNVDAIEVCLPADTPAPFLRRWGFIPAGKLALLFRTTPKSPLHPIPGAADLRIRPADGDNYFS